MTGLDAGVVGDWLAEADDAPIPLPWRGEVYYAPPPDGARGKRIAAYIALVNQKEPGQDDDKALRKILADEPLEALAIGRETYEQLVEAGMKGQALSRATNLCLIRWGYGSDEIARKYLEAVTGAPGDPEDEPAPK